MKSLIKFFILLFCFNIFFALKFSVYGQQIRHSSTITRDKLFNIKNNNFYSFPSKRNSNSIKIIHGLNSYVVTCILVNKNNIFAGTSSGGVFLSNDNGLTWKALNNGLTDTSVQALAISGSYMFAGTYGFTDPGGVFISSDNGENWVRSPSIYDNIMSFTVKDEKIFAGTLYGGVYLSTDKGTTWKQVNNGMNDTYIGAMAANVNSVFAGTKRGRIFHTTDDGVIWKAINNGLKETELWALFHYDNYLFVGNSEGVFRSSNNGISWDEMNPGLKKLEVLNFCNMNSTLLMGTWGRGIYMTTNGGTDWTQLNTEFTGAYIYSLAMIDNNLFIGTPTGIYSISYNNIADLLARPDSLTNNKRIWNFNNPFLQPFSTTDYYGSGDIDGDGSITEKDVQLVLQIANGTMPPVSRADVNGDCVVNSNDVALIQDAISGKILPSWWNKLSTREQRNEWFNKVLKIDKTNEQPYTSWFTCGRFSQQTALHFSGYGSEFRYHELDGGQTQFNIPVYCVSNDLAAHAYNAILVGDNPLSFTDWRFFEPQNDLDVHPGDWNMPLGSNVEISNMFGGESATKIVFHIESNSSYSIVTVNNDFIINRSLNVPSVKPQNIPYFFNPRVLDIDNGMFLCQRYRNDMSRTNDIHILDLNDISSLNITSGKALTNEVNYSYLLDLLKSEDGTYHLLWKGKPEYNPGLFYGVLDIATGTLKNIKRLSSSTPFIDNAKIVVLPNGEIHVFWNMEGIFWTKCVNGIWSTAQQIVTTNILWYPWFDQSYRAFYCFDAVGTKSGYIDLVLNETGQINNSYYGILKHLRYNGNWGQTNIIDSISTRWTDDEMMGVKLIPDIDNKTQMVYCKMNSDSTDNYLLYRYYDGISWSNSVILDKNFQPICPNLIRVNNSEYFLVWQRLINNSHTLSWKKYSHGNWSDLQNITTEQDAQNPSSMYKNNSLYVVYSTLSDSTVTINYKSISPIVNVSNNESLIAKSFKLEQNYPNPFNPITTISYSIPKTCLVAIKVYDVLGREINTIINDEKSAGNYKIEFDGSKYASGIYFYTMQAGDFTETKKLILLK